MTEQNSKAEALASPFDDVDIGSVLLSDGPIVQCVLLRSQIENSSAKKSCEVSDKETLHKLIKQIPVRITFSIIYKLFKSYLIKSLTKDICANKYQVSRVTIG